MEWTYLSKTLPTNLLAVAIAVGPLSCGDGLSTHPARIYTGEVADTDARVGIIASEHHARVFFCGGASSYETMTRWLTSDIDAAHKLSLQSTPEPSWKLQGDIGDTEVVGSVVMFDGILRGFRADVVSDRTISGLYEGTAPCGRLGLIVIQPTPDTSPAGQGACVGPTTLEQVNPLDPIVRRPDGTIAVTVGSAADERDVRAATPPPD